MLLETYSNEIESLEFQIQFSVVGGLKILQMAMDRHPTLISLRSAISDNARLEEEVFGRILFLLSKVDSEAQLSYDESIAAYLFCLSAEKPFTAYRASWSILDHGGLWWSVQLANLVKGDAKRNLDKFVASSASNEQINDTWFDSSAGHSLTLSFLFDYLRSPIDSNTDSDRFFYSGSRCVFDYGYRPVPDVFTIDCLEDSPKREKWTFAGKKLA